MYDPSEPNRIVTVWDMPVLKLNKGRDNWREVDETKLRANLVEAIVEYGVTDIILEDVHSSPQMGVTSAFTFGMVFGTIRTVVRLYGPKIHMVSPAVWKARMGLKGEKKNSVELARKTFGTEPWFGRVSKDGLAEAALLARYAARDLVVRDEDPLS